MPRSTQFYLRGDSPPLPGPRFPFTCLRASPLRRTPQGLAMLPHLLALRLSGLAAPAFAFTLQAQTHPPQPRPLPRFPLLLAGHQQSIVLLQPFPTSCPWEGRRWPHHQPRGCPREGLGGRGTAEAEPRRRPREEGRSLHQGPSWGGAGRGEEWDNQKGGARGWGSLRLAFKEGTEWDPGE